MYRKYTDFIASTEIWEADLETDRSPLNPPVPWYSRRIQRKARLHLLEKEEMPLGVDIDMTLRGQNLITFCHYEIQSHAWRVRPSIHGYKNQTSPLSVFSVVTFVGELLAQMDTSSTMEMAETCCVRLKSSSDSRQLASPPPPPHKLHPTRQPLTQSQKESNAAGEAGRYFEFVKQSTDLSQLEPLS